MPMPIPCQERREAMRGDFTYSQTCIDGDWGTIDVADRDGHWLAFILDNPGDWELIEQGADPVKDGWEDGCGHYVRDAVNIDRLAKRVQTYLRLAGDTDAGIEDIRDIIYRLNDGGNTATPYNSVTADGQDVRDIAHEYIMRRQGYPPL